MFAGLKRAISKHTSPSHWFLPKHNTASLEQGTSLLSCCGRCSSRAAIGTACSDPACFACLELGFIIFGDNLYIVKALTALEMQPRSQGLGTAEAFSRRSACLKDVIREQQIGRRNQSSRVPERWSVLHLAYSLCKKKSFFNLKSSLKQTPELLQIQQRLNKVQK